MALALHNTAVGLCLLCAGQAFAQQGFAGNWEIPLPVHGAASIYPMNIDVKGDTFTGKISIWPLTDGKINGDTMTFKMGRETGTGKLYGDQISILREGPPRSPNTLPVKFSWTAFRNRSGAPLDWVPEQVPPLPFSTTRVAQVVSSTGKPALAGRWEAPFVWGTKTYTYEFVFDSSDTGFTGNAGLLGANQTFKIADGKVNGDDISFTWIQGNGSFARFTGTLYNGQVALIMEEVGSTRLPEAQGAKVHPMTGFRNDGDVPWYTWFPSLLDHGKMGAYSTLARVVHDIYKKGDIKLAATLAQVLNNVWDHGENALLKSSPDVWGQIDQAMDRFILPIIRYQGGIPDPVNVDKTWQDYLTKLKLAN